jgi:hypothetical protein
VELQEPPPAAEHATYMTSCCAHILAIEC